MKKDTNTVILILLGVTAAIGFLTKYLFAFDLASDFLCPKPTKAATQSLTKLVC